MNDKETTALVLGSIIVATFLMVIIILSNIRDMQDAREDIGCTWVETGGDTMVRECK